MPTYRIIFKSGKEARLEVPQILDMATMGGDFKILDKTNKVIGFVCKEDISYIQKIFVKEEKGNEKSKNTNG
ncbi:MAG: hypothetical protein DDT22_00959 [candidate division WS2 bacterium]|nr:hypothetical protein [Candidatus Lithacetigena glycinireducens]